MSIMTAESGLPWPYSVSNVASTGSDHFSSSPGAPETSFHPYQPSASTEASGACSNAASPSPWNSSTSLHTDVDVTSASPGTAVAVAAVTQPFSDDPSLLPRQQQSQFQQQARPTLSHFHRHTTDGLTTASLESEPSHPSMLANEWFPQYVNTTTFAPVANGHTYAGTLSDTDMMAGQAAVPNGSTPVGAFNAPFSDAGQIHGYSNDVFVSPVHGRKPPALAPLDLEEPVSRQHWAQQSPTTACASGVWANESLPASHEPPSSAHTVHFPLSPVHGDSSAETLGYVQPGWRTSTGGKPIKHESCASSIGSISLSSIQSDASRPSSATATSASAQAPLAVSVDPSFPGRPLCMARSTSMEDIKPFAYLAPAAEIDIRKRRHTEADAFMVGPGRPVFTARRQTLPPQPDPDPNAPIRPDVPYFAFMKRVRRMLPPTATYAELTEQAATKWKQLPRQEVEQLERNHALQMEMYGDQMRAYVTSPACVNYLNYLVSFAHTYGLEYSNPYEEWIAELAVKAEGESPPAWSPARELFEIHAERLNNNNPVDSRRKKPRPDPHAPIKPFSAYVKFGRDLRHKLQEEDKSFSEISKIIGEAWRNMDPRRKERLMQEAETAKAKYQIALKNYQNTQSCREHQRYLEQFKMSRK